MRSVKNVNSSYSYLSVKESMSLTELGEGYLFWFSKISPSLKNCNDTENAFRNLIQTIMPIACKSDTAIPTDAPNYVSDLLQGPQRDNIILCCKKLKICFDTCAELVEKELSDFLKIPENYGNPQAQMKIIFKLISMSALFIKPLLAETTGNTAYISGTGNYFTLHNNKAILLTGWFAIYAQLKLKLREDKNVNTYQALSAVSKVIMAVFDLPHFDHKTIDTFATGNHAEIVDTLYSEGENKLLLNFKKQNDILSSPIFEKKENVQINSDPFMPSTNTDFHFMTEIIKLKKEKDGALQSESSSTHSSLYLRLLKEFLKSDYFKGKTNSNFFASNDPIRNLKKMLNRTKGTFEECVQVVVCIGKFVLKVGSPDINEFLGNASNLISLSKFVSSNISEKDRSEKLTSALREVEDEFKKSTPLPPDSQLTTTANTTTTTTTTHSMSSIGGNAPNSSLESEQSNPPQNPQIQPKI